MEIFRKFKTAIFAVAAFFLYLLGRRHGKVAVEVKQAKGKINAIKKAKATHDSLADPELVKRLHAKYKR